jgi:hypothetical protein
MQIEAKRIFGKVCREVLYKWVDFFRNKGWIKNKVDRIVFYPPCDLSDVMIIIFVRDTGYIHTLLHLYLFLPGSTGH